MVGPRIAVLVFGLAVAAASPQPGSRITINWPEEKPSFWPGNWMWPPGWSEEAPSWWPSRLPWPPGLPEEAPYWWPDSRPWPPGLPEDAPSWWPETLPWPPGLPEDPPSFWPEDLEWPPVIDFPEEWPERPEWWPEGFPWPPRIPEIWPERPGFWPEDLPWPPSRPEEWPDKPEWWPESLPWPPARPEEWPERPSFWPENLPWPPSIPDLVWPPPGVNPDDLPYIPSRDNQFHLFTRNNRAASNPLVFGNEQILWNSNWNSNKKTVILVHGAQESAISNFNALLVDAYLTAADVNVIVVDWSIGAYTSTPIASLYSLFSANFIARFTNWLTSVTGADLKDFHLVGNGLGGFNVFFVGLRLGRQVGYITALDPPRGAESTRFLPPLRPRVGSYSEVIHTNIYNTGYAQPLGHTDFYPNGGYDQPGCGGDSECNRARAIYFFAESLKTGGFTGIECEKYTDAFTGYCHGPKELPMGGLEPKTGKVGVFYLQTNNQSPFSKG